MSHNVCVIGAAAVPVGRFQAPSEAELQVLGRELVADTVMDAMVDAGVAREDIGSLIFGMERDYPKQRYFCTFMANYLRLVTGGNVQEVVSNGMTGGHAFDRAADDVALGRSRVALAIGINIESAIPTAEHLAYTMRHTGDVDFHSPFGMVPISWYAMDAMRYMHDFGVPREAVASVAVKNRRHAMNNPIAQFRKPLTLEDVLSARPIVDPLGLYEVPGRADGVVCIVLASEDVARGTGKPYLKLRGRGFHHEGAHQINDVPHDMTDYQPARYASQIAYEQAGVTVSDLDFAEIYAPCTIVEVLASEALGLVPRGEGAYAAADGVTSLGGDIPICTSGGCLSRGHPPFATGLYSYVEVVDQLLGRAGKRQVKDAQLGMAVCELGKYNAALVHVFEAMA
jgi:acetyl-CoA C-acetyltransferase